MLVLIFFWKLPHFGKLPRLQENDPFISYISPSLICCTYNWYFVFPFQFVLPLAFLYPIFCLSACIYFCIQSFVYLPVSSSILQLCAIFFPRLTVPPCPLHCNCLSPFFFSYFSSILFSSNITELVLTFSPILPCPLHYNCLASFSSFFICSLFRFAWNIFFYTYFYTCKGGRTYNIRNAWPLQDWGGAAEAQTAAGCRGQPDGLLLALSSLFSRIHSLYWLL